MKRIYLDNAATSWPKPEAVYAIVDRYQRELGAPAGRSAYREATEVERLVNDARRRVAQLLNADAPARIVFTSNGTDSLNLALLSRQIFIRWLRYHVIHWAQLIGPATGRSRRTGQSCRSSRPPAMTDPMSEARHLRAKAT